MDTVRALRGQHEPKRLTCDPGKLVGLSEKLIRSHWKNNYGGAVKALNAVEQRLAALLDEKDLPPFVYADLGGDGRTGGTILDLLKEWLGNYERWETEFRRTANALAGGSGWVILAYNPYNGEIHNYWAWDHMHNAPLARPLLVLDMYEHAYHMDYDAAAARYVDAFMQNVKWEEVNRRAEVALKREDSVP
ncbi:MAG: Fe-Mn family superoxide dismutase [Deltaproteobacteria bacterium]|nr:Fe-Mn family superoxide dismutase [Deltaproteobacteria bacterium]